MKNDNVIQIKSFAFAVKIVKVYQLLVEEKKEFVLSKQLLRAGTSIGANVEESIGGQSENTSFKKFVIRNLQFVIYNSLYLVTIIIVATAVAIEASAEAMDIHFIEPSSFFSGFLGTIISAPGVILGVFRKIKPRVDAVVPLG